MNKHQSYFGRDLEAMASATNYHQWIVDEFSPYLGRRVAEVGAGTGNFSDFLLRAGVEELRAFEPSVNMYPVLQDKFALDDRAETINAFFESCATDYEGAFDAVAYVNVLEHIEHDRTALKHAHATLKPGGHLLIFVPALPFLYSELDRKVGHFRRYKRDELVDVVTAAGFRIDWVKYFDILGIIPWYIAFTRLKLTTSSANVSIYDKLAVPLMRRLESLVTPPVGKNLILVAHRG